MELESGQNWQPAYQANLIAPPTGVRNINYPIPAFRIPQPFSSPALIVGASSATAKPTWRLAAYIDVLINVEAIGYTQLAHVFIPLGAIYIFVDRSVSAFYLQVYVPRWYQSLDLEVWQYVGPV